MAIKPVKVGDRLVGPGEPVYIIAEIGINHNGDMKIAKDLIEMSAKAGVDAVKFDECLSIAGSLRGAAGCGDYQQTTGQLLIPKGSNEAGFKVRIMNDQCYERFLEFVQVTLSVPGSSALQGETLVAKIRIDDDDFLSSTC